ncbi:MAG: hypothetical protein HYS12_11740 [Planctomycetes bacterium]|nr:hypothetical protein [Planctomycetota bacterium]
MRKLNGDILRGLYRRRPDLDVVRVQDVGLSATPDPDVLAWAAVGVKDRNRLLIGGEEYES